MATMAADLNLDRTMTVLVKRLDDALHHRAGMVPT
jgi:hypothetical protein